MRPDRPSARLPDRRPAVYAPWCDRTPGDRAFDLLPAFRRQAFSELDALNGALKDALDRPSEGARLAAHKAAARAATQLDRLVADDAPLILSYTPRFVPPRRATGELTLAPNAPNAAPGPAPQGALRLDTPGGPAANQAVQAVPRYAPDFAAAGDDDPPLQIEIVGRTGICGRSPPCCRSCWRGQATVSPDRLRFSVPLAPLTDARRTGSRGALSIGAVAHGAVQLLSRCCPTPGSFAFDQRVRATTLDPNPVSPDILSRAPAASAHVRRCFDPPAGWRFEISVRACHRRARAGRMTSASRRERGVRRVRPCREARTGLHRRDRPPGHAQRANGDDWPFRGDPGA